jgi:hypothetical protein
MRALESRAIMKFLPLDSMRISRYLLPAAAAICVVTTGCAAHIYAPPPPPGAYASPLLQQADHRGMRAGYDDGARDAASGFGYHPRHDRKYAETPGYDPAIGPYPPYRDTFRNAYLRGYYNGFHHL